MKHKDTFTSTVLPLREVDKMNADMSCFFFICSLITISGTTVQFSVNWW
jgi:hypothetical protein